MAKEEVDEAMKELKAKLEEKAESKPAPQSDPSYKPDPASRPDPALDPKPDPADEDQRKLFVGGLAQVRICFRFEVHDLNAVTLFRMPRILTSRSISVTYTKLP